ncbi:MAG: glycosyltransferase [Aliifodinibius sp.]|nr:glycosyltransferase [Phycisphaerae bacterium]NIR67016.1 glycosyltransferase [candidate division Zixibacteria bacterium]NIT60911.1 glycosyltransferase [Fodinibius sp.]NIW48955.1 glycosyltransferase [Gammaproteobacteria bacterium]NIS48437.1 glycosyltransferase [candidate division Zixibacteria bacterium]
MKVGVTTIAYNQTDTLRKMVKTISETSVWPVEFHIFLNSTNKAVSDVCSEISVEHDAIIYRYGYNRGVARSWNDGIVKMADSSCDYMFVVNDDVWVSTGDVNAMINAADEHRDNYAIMCSGWNDGDDRPVENHGMAFFLINPIAIGKLGFFDENFFPAYNEDLDYDYRARLAGLNYFLIKDTMVHHVGSSAIKTSPFLKQQNYITHHRNDVYWLAKWGIEKHEYEENPRIVNRRPFNVDRFHPYYIAEEDRHEPYPDFNRTDQGIVRF